MPELFNWFVVFVRAGALLLSFPVFSGQNLPVLMRVGIAAVVAALISTGIHSNLSIESSIFQVIGVLIAEASIGLLLGFVCSLVFHAIEAAGNLVSNEIGLTLASVFNPNSNNLASTPGMLLHWMGVMLLLTMNLHHWILIGLHRSFVLVPVGAGGLGETLFTEVVARIGGVFAIAVQMTAPVMACSFLITTVFALLGRAVPQMNVFSESFAFRTMAGLGVIGMTCVLSGQHIANHLRRFPEVIQRICTLLAQPQ